MVLFIKKPTKYSNGNAAQEEDSSKLFIMVNAINVYAEVIIKDVVNEVKQRTELGSYQSQHLIT